MKKDLTNQLRLATVPDRSPKCCVMVTHTHTARIRSQEREGRDKNRDCVCEGVMTRENPSKDGREEMEKLEKHRRNEVDS